MLPTSAHIIYIPMVLLLGIFLGFVLGTRAARGAMELERKRDEERRLAREARKQRRQQNEARND